MSDQRETVEYGGKTRQVIGRLHYPRGAQSAAGTLIGPNAWGETCVVLGHEPEVDRVPTSSGMVTLIGRAIVSDVESAGARLDDPQSVAEFRTRLMTQQVPEMFRAGPFGGPR